MAVAFLFHSKRDVLWLDESLPRASQCRVEQCLQRVCGLSEHVQSYFYVDLHSHDVCIVVVVSSAASSLGSANSSDSIAGWQLGQVDFDFQRNVLACATWSNDNQSCLALVLQHHYSVLQSLVS